MMKQTSKVEGQEDDPQYFVEKLNALAGTNENVDCLVKRDENVSSGEHDRDLKGLT